MAIWLPGFERAGSAKEAGGTMNGSPARFVCHTTEGFSRDPLGAARSHEWPPHLWVTLPSHPYSPRRKIQVVPLDRSAFALEHPAGTPETNKAGAVQVEIEGNAQDMAGLSFEDLDWLADEVIGPACAATGVDASQFIQGVGSATVSAGRSAQTRMSWVQWAVFHGICSHQNVPGNEHWDAGGLDLAHISARITGGSKGDDVTPDDIEAVAQRVTAYLANPQTNPGTIIDGGARNALAAVQVAVADPTSGVRAILLAQQGSGGVDPAALASQIVDAVGSELAAQVVTELGNRLGSKG